MKQDIRVILTAAWGMYSLQMLVFATYVFLWYLDCSSLYSEWQHSELIVNHLPHRHLANCSLHHMNLDHKQRSQPLRLKMCEKLCWRHEISMKSVRHTNMIVKYPLMYFFWLLRGCLQTIFGTDNVNVTVSIAPPLPPHSPAQTSHNKKRTWKKDNYNTWRCGLFKHCG